MHFGSPPWGSFQPWFCPADPEALGMHPQPPWASKPLERAALQASGPSKPSPASQWSWTAGGCALLTRTLMHCGSEPLTVPCQALDTDDSISSSQSSRDRYYYYLIFQMKNLRLRDVRGLGQNHTAINVKPELKPGGLSPRLSLSSTTLNRHQRAYVKTQIPHLCSPHNPTGTPTCSHTRRYTHA